MVSHIQLQVEIDIASNNEDGYNLESSRLKHFINGKERKT
jgi:hypothetical protein